MTHTAAQIIGELSSAVVQIAAALHRPPGESTPKILRACAQILDDVSLAVKLLASCLEAGDDPKPDRGEMN